MKQPLQSMSGSHQLPVGVHPFIYRCDDDEEKNSEDDDSARLSQDEIDDLIKELGQS